MGERAGKSTSEARVLSKFDSAAFLLSQARRKRDFKKNVPVFGAALGAQSLFPSHCNVLI